MVESFKEGTVLELPPPTNAYEADARTKIATLRAIAADFELPAPRTLTTVERRIASSTPPPFIEKAANFCEVVPSLGEAANTDSAELRDGEDYAAAYDPLIVEIQSLWEVVRKAVAFRRLKNARAARVVFRLAKTYVNIEGGDNAKTYIAEMRKALPRRRRYSAGEGPAGETEPKAGE
jgi:hypothetical protein